MTNEATDCAEHAWRTYTDDEMKDLRSKTRTGRPPMAWVEEAEQCEKCGRVEAKVSCTARSTACPTRRRRRVAQR